MRKPLVGTLSFIFIGSFFALALHAQTTEFTYQGKLTDTTVAASGTYDFEFRLFALSSGGSNIGLLSRPGVVVTNGVFTVNLDFGNVFTGASRFLEIGVKKPADPSFTTIAPRQSVTSSPYSVRSLNAAAADVATNSAQLNGIAASQYVLTGDARLSDARTPTAGSANYIQNRTSQQSSSNFHISGDGTADGSLNADIVRATTHYSLAGVRVLSTAGANNVFVGPGTGTNNNTGSGNSFLGQDAGNANTDGSFNTFVGRWAGFSNVITGSNTFVGFSAGKSNTGSNNSFFGSSAGSSNTTGYSNSYFGTEAGQDGINVYRNSFFGYRAGKNGGGTGNSYFGAQAGELSGSTGNSFFGESSGQNNSGGANSFFGASAGILNNSGYENVFIGYTAGLRNTSGFQNTFVGNSAGVNTTTDVANTIGDDNTLIGAGANVGSGNLIFATAIGASAVVNTSNTIALGRIDGSDTVDIPGKLQIDTLATPGLIGLCLNSSNRVGTCSSSLRYKTNLAPYGKGFDIVRRLRPITFNWKDGGMRDVGFGAEDVEKIDPLLVTYNAKGEVEGVKYDRISAVLVNAVKEQQEQIELLVKQNQTQQDQIQQQLQLIKKITKSVCAMNPNADICHN